MQQAAAGRQNTAVVGSGSGKTAFG